MKLALRETGPVGCRGFVISIFHLFGIIGVVVVVVVAVAGITRTEAVLVLRTDWPIVEYVDEHFLHWTTVVRRLVPNFGRVPKSESEIYSISAGGLNLWSKGA